MVARVDTFLSDQSRQLLTGQGSQSGFYIQDAGHEAFLHRAALIEAAEQTIDAQYYIWSNDRSGRYLAGRLLRAADRGVRVRLLVDDFNAEGIGPLLMTLANHPNIRIRIFNPAKNRSGAGRWMSFILDFQRINRRMHNKTFVVDGAVGIVGGRNIGDEYFGLHHQRYFRDRDVVALGPVVEGMSGNFLAYWDSGWSYPVAELYPPEHSENETTTQLQDLRDETTEFTGVSMQPAVDPGQARVALDKLFSRMTLARGEVIFDPPFQTTEASGDSPKRSAVAVQRLARDAKYEVLIESAYLILTGEELEALERPAGSRVRIAALTNSLASNDLVTNHSGYARWREEMIAAGLDLYELRPDAGACLEWLENEDFCSSGDVSLHTKSLVFDRRTLVVGSFNVNLRSIYLNGETVLVIHSPELAKRVAGDIDSLMAPANSWRVVLDDSGELRWLGEGQEYTHEPTVGWWRRVMSRVLSWLPIEKYL